MTTDLRGLQVGHLMVIRRAGSHRSRAGQVSATWLVRCDCGNEETRTNVMLRNGRPTSACMNCVQKQRRLRRLTHGQTDTPTYITWSTMIDRCRNEHRENFQHYGGRGIKVCERWKIFENFLADVGERPAGTTLDRINTNGNYEPGNCRWVNQRQQMRNTRKTIFIEYEGRRLPLVEWAEITGLPRSCLRERLALGWSSQRTLTTRSRRRR